MKEIAIEQVDQFMFNKYPSEGIYHNTTTTDIVAVSLKVNFVVFIGKYHDFGHLFKKEITAEQDSVPKVTEGFALRLAAILTNNDKMKEYEI